MAFGSTGLSGSSSSSTSSIASHRLITETRRFPSRLRKLGPASLKIRGPVPLSSQCAQIRQGKLPRNGTFQEVRSQSSKSRLFTQAVLGEKGLGGSLSALGC